MRKPKPNDQTEHYIKGQVRKILTDTGWEFWMPSANAFGRGGQADFLAVKAPKLFMAVETKYDDVATVLQIEFLGHIYGAGHYALLVDETNVNDLQKLLVSNTPAHLVDTRFSSLMKWRYQDPLIDIRRVQTTLTP